MINSVSKELCEVEIPFHEGDIKMLPFDLSNLQEVPEKFRPLVQKMTSQMPRKSGIAYLTVDGRTVQKNTTHRLPGAHIDGNFIPGVTNWGGTAWRKQALHLSPEEHKIAYQSSTGGMILASTFSACKGWNGQFEGVSGPAGDCSHIETGEGFLLKPNVAYYGSSQFLHESLPIENEVHRTLVRITLPMDYPTLN